MIKAFFYSPKFTIFYQRPSNESKEELKRITKKLEKQGRRLVESSVDPDMLEEQP